MEAGRPGWYDALNGLPGQFGVSLSDAADLVRLIRMLGDLADRYDQATVELPDALWALVARLAHIGADPDSHSRWLARWAARDEYRAALDHRELSWSSRALGELVAWLAPEGDRLAQRLRDAASEHGGILPTYYAFEPTGWQPADESSTASARSASQSVGTMAGDAEPTDGRFVVPSGLRRRVLPHFLEGAVKQIRLAPHDEARRVHECVRASDLFDDTLGMYRVNAPLSGEPPTIGRARAFPDGWLEDGSIWLHMEYKYLLELLRSGLAEEFWDDAMRCLIPFLDPDVYGRSTHENSSFLASSLYPESGELVFSPRPVLPGRLFGDDGILTWPLFGCEVRYRNPSRRDLYPVVDLDGTGSGNVPVQIVVTRNDGREREETYPGALRGAIAAALRSRQLRRMVVLFS